jgi:hypothetical protein
VKKDKTMTVQKLWEDLTCCKDGAKVLLRLRHKDGRVILGELIDRPPDVGYQAGGHLIELHGRWAVEYESE